MTMHEFSNRVRNYPQGTAWMSFYIYIRFPLGLVLGCLSFFSVAATMSDSSQPGADSGLLAFCIFIDLAYLAFTVITFIYMRKFTMTGYTLNQIYLICAAVINGLSSAVGTYNEESLSFMWFIGSGVYALVFVLPNWIYFRKRIDLFNGEYPEYGDEEYVYSSEEYTDPVIVGGVVIREPMRKTPAADAAIPPADAAPSDPYAEERCALHEKVSAIDAAIRTLEAEKSKAEALSMTPEEALAAWSEGKISNDQLKAFAAQGNNGPAELRKYTVTLEALHAQKQDALQQLQAMDSAAPNAPPAVQPPFAESSASQPSFYAADETSRRGLSQKAKAILILCAVSVLIIVIASVAVHSRKERTAGNGSRPAVGQTVYWQDGKYHSRPDCPLLDDEASVLERRYVDDEKHPRFCVWCWDQ